MKKNLRDVKKKKIIVCHLMRWILLKNTKGRNTESEQQKNILKTCEVAGRRGMELVLDIHLVLASVMKNGDCPVTVSHLPKES